MLDVGLKTAVFLAFALALFLGLGVGLGVVSRGHPWLKQLHSRNFVHVFG